MSRGLHAIIFDFDGVLADSERLHLRAFQDVLADEGLTLSPGDYTERYLGYDDAGVFHAVARDAGREWPASELDALMARKAARYEALAEGDGLLFPGAADFVRLAAAAVPVAIASGALTREITDVLDQAGLRSLVPVVVGADQTTQTKPEPEPYLTAFARLQQGTDLTLDPRRTVAIEDSRWGLESARRAGLRTVAVSTTYDADSLAAHAELVVAGLDALDLALLDRLCGD